MSKIVLILIGLYQKYLSFDTGLGRFLVYGRPVCRHSPTCSQYTYNMIQEHGVVKGLMFGSKRILSCNPLVKFQMDIVSNTKN